MNTKSLLISILVAFLAVWLTDFLIHQVWLSSSYGATKHLWRTEADMMSRMPLMFLGQLLIAAAFTMIFAACVAEKRCISCTLKFSTCIGILSAGGQLMMYVVQPIPGELVAKWCAAAIAQALLLGVIVHKVYRLPAK